MDDDIQEIEIEEEVNTSTEDIIEIEEEANTSTNASPRSSCITPDRQALADSIMESVNASVTASISKLRRGDVPTIYIVPQRMRKVKEVAYEPKMVSIGPYHHGNKSLQGMEENKLLYLHSFLSRNPNYPLEVYLEEMEELEDEARRCYSDNIGPQVGSEFVKMMVLDACFIVEIFLRFNRELNKEDLDLTSAMDQFFLHSNGFEDPIRCALVMWNLVRYDMLLLENQIPFFVLQRIFIMACPVNVPHLLEKMALRFLDHFMPTNKKIEIQDNSYCHLLHLFHSHLLPIPTNSKEEPNHSCIPKIKLKPDLSCIPKIKLKPNLSCNPKIKSVLNKLKNLLPCSNKAPLPITDGKNLLCNPIIKETSLPITEPRLMIPCATDLQLAGVKFKKNEKSNNILNVKFSHGVLEITPFLIHGDSETLFRNLVAFEQCCRQCCPLQLKFHFFTTYFLFMDYLVNTSKDVALLHQNGIIDHFLGSDDDVALLFNQLCIGTFHDINASYLSDVKNNVRKHCENQWNIWWASLKRDYFTNPWSFISLIAASILLLLTITQTFFTVFPHDRPRS